MAVIFAVVVGTVVVAIVGVLIDREAKRDERMEGR